MRELTDAGNLTVLAKIDLVEILERRLRERLVQANAIDDLAEKVIYVSVSKVLAGLLEATVAELVELTGIAQDTPPEEQLAEVIELFSQPESL